MSIIKSNNCYLSNNALIWMSNLLTNWLGTEIIVNNFDTHSYQIILVKYKKILVVDNLVEDFYNPNANLSFTFWNCKSEGYESILHEPLPSPGYAVIDYPIIEFSNDILYLHYDLIGLIYWSLVRVEEYHTSVLDKHNRFQNISSHANQFNYLDRPLIDEWIHVIKQIINSKYPEIIFKKNKFKIILSHDVDRPFFYYFLTISNLFRICIGDILKRGSIISSLRRIRFWVEVNYFKNYQKDPYNTFDYIMKEADIRGIKSYFYFMTSGENSNYDADYLIDNILIITLIKKILDKGHFIGIHPSYETYLNPLLIKKEVNILLETLSKIGIIPTNLESRMHYLRYDISKTPNFLSQNGIKRDSSLNYANESGFRCGTCFDYQMFDHLSQRQLNLIQRPLLVMDNNFLPINNSKNFESKINNIFKIKERCKLVNGNFTVLWHNSELYNLELKNLFLEIIN